MEMDILDDEDHIEVICPAVMKSYISTTGPLIIPSTKPMMMAV
jgi:hypothetical protein